MRRRRDATGSAQRASLLSDSTLTMAAFVLAVLAQDDKSPALSELIDRVRQRGFIEFSPAVYKGLKSIAQAMVQG